MCLALPGLSGCGKSAEQTEGDIMIVVDRPEEETVYITTEASYNDVSKTARIMCNYNPTEEYEVSASLIGKKIEDIYVKEGDPVEKGQIIAMLSGGNIQDEIDALSYRIARNELLLESLVQEENEALSYRWWTFLYRSSLSEADRENLDQSLEDIRRDYRYQREDYEDSIRLDRLQLELYQQEMDECLIRSEIDGEVLLVNDDLVGQTLKKKTVLATLFDNSQCVFESSQSQYAYCFQENQPVEMTVIADGSPMFLEVVPMNIENWDEQLIFVPLSAAGASIPAGASGKITITADSRSHVLTVPNGAVYRASNGDKYVYTQDENNVRQIRWVETGLVGDELTEIVSGLTEGEIVLIK